MNYKFFSILFFTACILVAACDDTCSDNKTADRQVTFKFKKWSKSTTADTSVNKVSIYNLADTFFYKESTAGQVKLLLSPLADSSTFVLKTDSTRDTLTIRYRRSLQMECGFNSLFYFKNISYTDKEVIDTVIITETDINKDVPENFQIVFKTRKTVVDTTTTDTTKTESAKIFSRIKF